MSLNIKKGDILLVKYKYDPIGMIACWKCKCYYNHVAWAINNTQVVEVRRHGIIINPINRFYNKNWYNIKWVRIKNYNKEIMKKAVHDALKLVGVKYTFLKLFKSMLRVGFTKKKNINPKTCSGMIAECLAKYNVYFRHDKHPLRITPGDIENSRSVENV